MKPSERTGAVFRVVDEVVAVVQEAVRQEDM